jgi:hypothetical protein
MNVADGFAYLNGKKLEVLLLLQPRLTTVIQVFDRGKRFKLPSNYQPFSHGFFNARFPAITVPNHSGMPYTMNLQTAMEVETVIRDNGAVPTTIAILEGVPHVGLSSEQLKRLAKWKTIPADS